MKSHVFASAVGGFVVSCAVLCPPTASAVTAEGAGTPAVVASIPTCFGRAATIVGAPGEDRLYGTAGPDVIFSQWDDQWIYGLGGDDRVCGHANIYGGPGDDRLSVRSEAEFLDMSEVYGGPGNDVIYRDETLTDDPHFELLTVGGRGHDRLFGGPNLDDLRGGPGRDRIFGRGLRDDAAGGAGPDYLVGGPGRDRLRGFTGDDRLVGGAHGDVLNGGRGVDLGRGGPGDDLISGGPGAKDVAIGGAGFDSCVRAEEVQCEKFR